MPIRTSDQFRRGFVQHQPTEPVEQRAGGELELWIVRKDSDPTNPKNFMPHAERLIAAVRKKHLEVNWVATEFSGCQVELRTAAHLSAEKFISEMLYCIKLVREVARNMELDLVAVGLAPDGVPEVTPNIDRYLNYADSLTNKIKAMMFRVAALHLHFAVNEADVFQVYNDLVDSLSELSKIEGVVTSDRVRLFEQDLYTAATPVKFEDWSDMFEHYRQHNKLKDPSQHWVWVRISPARPDKPLTVEVRLPDATEDPDVITKSINYLMRVVRNATRRMVA